MPLMLQSVDRVMKAIAWFALAAAAVGCAPSEAEIKREFADFVDAHQACSQDQDCTLIQPGCPLGCSVPLSIDAAADGERLARDLIEDYESGGRACAYGCRAVCGAACEAARCIAVEPTPADGACP